MTNIYQQIDITITPDSLRAIADNLEANMKETELGDPVPRFVVYWSKNHKIDFVFSQEKKMDIIYRELLPDVFLEAASEKGNKFLLDHYSATATNIGDRVVCKIDVMKSSGFKMKCKEENITYKEV